MRTSSRLGFLATLLAVAAVRCASTAAPATDSLRAMNDVAERYVKLVLAVGSHDKDYVDAFYGPPAWKSEAEAAKRPLPEIASEASGLIARLEALPEPADGMLRLRRTYLTRQLQSLSARVACSAESTSRSMRSRARSTTRSLP